MSGCSPFDLRTEIFQRPSMWDSEAPNVFCLPLPDVACKRWAAAAAPRRARLLSPTRAGLLAPITELAGGRVLALLVFNSFVTIESVFLVITYTPVIAKHNFQGVKLKLQSAPLRNTYLCLKAPC